MMNNKNVRIVIPVHPGKDVKPGLIKSSNEGSWVKQRRLP